MASPDRRIGRREFLRTAGLMVGSLATAEAMTGFNRTRKAVDSAVRIAEIVGRDDGYNFLRNAEKPRDELIPPSEFIGISVNTPFLWKEEDEGKIEGLVRKAKRLGAKSLRILINDDEDEGDRKKYGLETKLGIYNPEVIAKIRRFTGVVSRAGGREMGIVADLFDGWNLFRSDKCSYTYGKHVPKSPYILPDFTLEENRVNFFNKPEVRERFKARLRYMVNGLKDENNIIGWGVINEGELDNGMREEEKRRIMTEAYNDYIQEIRTMDKDRPVLTGLARPWYIDENKIQEGNIINTIHTYPNSALFNFDGPLDLDPDTRSRLQKHFRGMKFPLINQEIGVPDTFATCDGPLPPLPVPDDRALARFWKRIANLGVVDNKLFLWHFGLWKMDMYDDNYSVDPDTHPETLFISGKIGEILEKKIDLRAKVGNKINSILRF